MYIRRLLVAGWRGLDAELADLSPGLNLVCGPNEAGKSRLVQALRFALFESSRGAAAHKQALESWGAVDGRPRVEVEFELAGSSWVLEKTFLGRGCNTLLRGAGRTLEGEEAEARLADLLGVAVGGAKEMKSAERGIWSLLWVDQGESRHAPEHNEIVRGRLQDQLTAEIGEAAAGEVGLRILQRARDCKERFYTARTEGEKPVLRDARERVRAARERHTEAARQHDAIAEAADSLVEHRAREVDLRARTAAAEASLDEIDERHRQAAAAAHRLERCQGQVELAALELERARQRLKDCTELTERQAQLAQTIAGLDRALASAAAARQRAEAASTDAAAAVTGTDQELVTLAAELQDLRRRQKVVALRAEQSRLIERQDEAAALALEIAATRAALAELPPMTAADASALRAARQQAEAARARVEGASASVEILARQPLVIDGVPLPTGSTRTALVEDEKRIDVDGLLTLVVRPGGGELARLRGALTDAETELARQMTTLGVADVADAERIAQRRRELEGELERQRLALSRRLPEGRDEIEARLREIASQLEAAGVGPQETFDPRALDRAEAHEQTLMVARDAARVRRDERERERGVARDGVRDLEIQIREKRRQAAELDDQRVVLPEAELQAAAEHAQRTFEERVAAREMARVRYQVLGGEGIELQLQQARQSVNRLRDEHRNVQAACMWLEGRLENAGDDARHERVLDLEAELLQAQADLDRLEREARAARRLHEVLDDQYRRARERLTAPVVARIRPYLTELFPGTEVWLDDELNLLGMRGTRTDAAFEALSGGAREQLSLLVRIGLAEALSTGESWPLVLDDVLVNTDAERIRRMQRLLFRASRRMQILLFTCHGPLFDLLGPDRRIELEARTAAAAPT